MTETFYSWLQSAACYFIVVSAVLNFLPDNSYKKYIQYYMGLLLILVILSPVLKFTGIQENIDAYMEDFQALDSSREEWRQRAQEWEKQWQQKIMVVEGEEVVP